MRRREFLRGAGGVAGLGLMGGLAGCAAKKPVVAAPASAGALPFYDAVPRLVPIRAHEDRIFRITVCLRPFRMEGPRIEAERVGDKVVVHNYGHGGSGWSLSWGSSGMAVGKAMEALAAAGGGKDVAVIGAGALGLTSASLLQRAGAKVTIYAKERPPFVRSARATGSWTPDSRVAFASKVAAGFPAQWEEMARSSWTMYQSYLGMAGNPVEYTDRYELSDRASGPARMQGPAPKVGDEELDFARYGSRIQDITAGFQELPPSMNPFPTKYARRTTTLTFNVADYSRQLVTDFLIEGGKIEPAEFHSPSELNALPQRVIINCTGYGARALWKDESVIPVRGQIAWLIPQPEVNYGFYYSSLNVVGRRDGIVVQASEQGEASGWRDENETPDRGEAVRAVQTLAGLYARMGTGGQNKTTAL